MNEQEMVKQIERRISERHIRDCAVYYCLSGKDIDTNKTTAGKLINISDGGLSFIANEKYTPGKQLDFVLESPGLQTSGGLFVATGDTSDIVLLRTKGQVVWVRENNTSNEFETGISFTSPIEFKLSENE